MDLLGNYNSDSDSDDDSKSNTVAPLAPKASPRPGATTNSILDKKLQLAPTSISQAVETKGDKKKRAVGKKLLKLAAVLPEHILNQLQLDGGGRSLSKDNNESDSDDESSDEDFDKDERRSKTVEPNRDSKTIHSAKDYSRDEGLIGLLSELSKSGSLASHASKKRSILGDFTPDSDGTDHKLPSSRDRNEPAPSSDKRTKYEPLGAAFLTTTVETIKRKRDQPVEVQNIHGPPSSSTEATQTSVDSSVAPVISRPSVIMPPPIVRAAPSLRSAAPRVGVPLTSYPTATATYNGKDSIHLRQPPQQQFTHQKKKKKPMSRKRQMEQMLRAGKLGDVQGDHELQGVVPVYHHDAENTAAMAAASSSRSNLRMVPTGSYDASTGATSISSNVTSRQKTTNQLNSLLANAASLESHRAQTSGFLGGTSRQGNSHRATAKRKYGW